MNKKLITTMHWLVLIPISVTVIVLILNQIESASKIEGSGELGNSLFYALIYFCALIVGFLGWILSIIVLIREKQTRDKHWTFAGLYTLIGLVGFSYAYYLMQAS